MSIRSRLGRFRRAVGRKIAGTPLLIDKVAKQPKKKAKARKPAPPKQPARGYISKRQHLVYYTYIDRIVRALASDAKSLLDVGSSNAVYLEAFDWIPERHALDVGTVYSSPNVKGINENFFTYEPERKYDFVTCFQVLEHIPDAAAFARRLMYMSDRVLISVPFMWRDRQFEGRVDDPNGNRHHVHDPVDIDKIASWFGRKPDYSIVVQEPFGARSGGRRVIAYFQADQKMPPIKTLRDKLKKRLRA